MQLVLVSFPCNFMVVPDYCCQSTKQPSPIKMIGSLRSDNSELAEASFDKQASVLGRSCSVESENRPATFTKRYCYKTGNPTQRARLRRDTYKPPGLFDSCSESIGDKRIGRKFRSFAVRGTRMIRRSYETRRTVGGETYRWDLRE